MFLQTNASTGWITFFQIITMLGGYLGFFVTFIIIFLKNKKLGVVFAFTFALACAVNFVLKKLIRRDRPFVAYDSIANYGGEDGFSFPSGHSLCGGLFATFLIYHLFLQVKDKWTRICGCGALSLFPLLIGFSRMILGVHYLTDVIAGIIIGITFAIIGICVYNTIERKKLTIKRGQH